MNEITKISLFKITTKMQEIEDEIAISGGEITEHHEKLLEEIGNELVNKTDNVVSWIDSMNAKILLCDEEIERFKSIKDKLQKTLNKFNEYILNCMDNIDRKCFEGELRSIKIRKPSIKVEITNEDDIPLDLISTTTKVVSTINKNELKKILKSGQSIPGAKLIEGSRSLIIK